MNIVIMAEYILKSGVGVYVNALCKQLKINNNVFMMANEYVFDDNIDIFIKRNLTKAKPIALLKNVFYLRKFFKTKKIDVVQMNHRRCAFLMKVYNFVYWFDKMPCCWILHTQSMPLSLPYRMITYAGHKAIAISSEVRDFLVNKVHIKENRVELILNGIDATKLQPLTSEEKLSIKNKYGIYNDKIVVCAHGRIDKVKGLDVIVNAVNSLSKEYKDKLIVLLSGDTNNDYCKELQNMISQFCLNDNFVFMGWVSPREIFGISDLAVMPSRREGFPLSAIEAFFMKVPCIRTKTGGYQDMKMVCDSIEIDNAECVAKKLIAFVDNKNIYDKMTKDAYEFAKLNCTIQVMTQNTLAIFESLKKERG